LERFIDDQWRDILAGQGFSPRMEEDGEVWRSCRSDARVVIDHQDDDPHWNYYVNHMLIENGDDPSKLLFLLENHDEKCVEYGKEPNEDDKQWLKSIGINVVEVKKACKRPPVAVWTQL
jgi:hypothetical protein